MHEITVESVKTSGTCWCMRWNPNTQQMEEFTWNPDTEPGPPPIEGRRPLYFLEQMPRKA